MSFKVTLAGGVLLAAGLTAAGASAAVLLTVDEAVDLAFPHAEVRRQTFFLNDSQKQEVQRLAGSPLASALVVRYQALRDGTLVGFAYVDTHKVRTLAATLLVVVNPQGSVQRVEVLAFDEPLEYMPRKEWYGLLRGRRLDGELALKRGVRPVAGATLTASATVAAVRRVLALHAVLGELKR